MQQIADWLEKLGLSEYAQRFAEKFLRLREPYRDRITGRHADPAYEKAT